MSVGIKGLISPQWKSLQRRYFRHRITVVHAGGFDRHGKPVDAESVSTPCLIDGQFDRRRANTSDDVVQSYTVEFPSTILVKPEDRLEDGRARDGTVLLPKGRIQQIADIDHEIYGRLGQSARVVPL